MLITSKWSQIHDSDWWWVGGPGGLVALSKYMEIFLVVQKKASWVENKIQAESFAS